MAASKIQMAENWLRSKKLFYQVMMIGTLLVPIILYFVPLDWLESQQTICLFKNLTGHDCLGCGTTRAVISAVHLNFKNAWSYNYNILFVFPLLIFYWIKLILYLYKKCRCQDNTESGIFSDHIPTV